MFICDIRSLFMVVERWMQFKVHQQVLGCFEESSAATETLMCRKIAGDAGYIDRMILQNNMYIMNAITQKSTHVC